MESGYCVVSGVPSDLSDKMLSMASSSACRVAYICETCQWIVFSRGDSNGLNIAQFVCSVSCLCYQFPVSYKHTTNWNFTGG